MRQAERDERDRAREVTRRNASRMAMEDLQVMPPPLQASSPVANVPLNAPHGLMRHTRSPAMIY